MKKLQPATEEEKMLNRLCPWWEFFVRAYKKERKVRKNGKRGTAVPE
jgi:hypothetical protein